MTISPAAPPAQRAWWSAAALLFAAAVGTNVSTPLLLLYRDELRLSPAVLTAIFGVYALGLAPSLLFGGPASDRYGRTTVLVPATVLVAVASSVFLLGAHSEAILFVARFVQGLATGVAFSAGSAWLQDLIGPGRSQQAARRASLALSAGFSLGPLTSGLLAQFAPAPLVLPYLVHIAIVVALGSFAIVHARRCGVWQAGRSGRPGSGLLPRPGLTPAGRRVFRRALIPVAICVYAFPSVAVTVLPLTLHHLPSAVLFSGIIGAVALGAGAAVQPFADRLGRRRAIVGVAGGALGYAVGVAGAITFQPVLVFASGLLLGGGGGLCLNAGLLMVTTLAPAERRGAVNGLFYTWAYLGFAAPFLCTSAVGTGGLAVPVGVLAALAVATTCWLASRPEGSVGAVVG